jgi:hypothetical protein
MEKSANGLYLRARRGAFRRIFYLSEKLGLHITPNLYSFPIPDTRELKDSLWSNCSELIGIDMSEERQLELLSLFLKFKNEYDSFPKDKPLKPFQYYLHNNYFGSVDGEVLYCMIRHFKPRKVFEIGSGYSTYLSAQAILKNKQEDGNYDCELAAIDPFPNNTLRNGFPGLSTLIPQKVEEIPISEFNKLKENDILFIDSSHVLKIGGDVWYEYLEILPRLNKGVSIHIHDIFLPLEYQKQWIFDEYRYWNEQYLLQAFLAFNDSFEIEWAGSYMHLYHPHKLQEAFGSYSAKYSTNAHAMPPGSFWIRRIN